jgi:glycosyltransferase involved in cell wall biosynthesis
MLEAFNRNGYDVTVVTGRARKRRKAIREIMSAVANGTDFRFIYSESVNIPTLLSEAHHMPFYPFLDFRFFRWMRSRDVPVGLFYRDIHWRFPFYKDLVPFHKRIVLTTFFKYDWNKYRNVVDHLFLPSRAMIEALPGPWDAERATALYPGCNLHLQVERTNEHSGSRLLKLFYVGGILPPLYDIRPSLEALKDLGGISLTICCKTSEWEVAQKQYGRELLSYVNVVHEKGVGLSKYYSNADIFLLFRRLHPYLKFSMQVKIFESIGYCLPIITNAGTVSADFIKEQNIGWVVDSEQELRDLITKLRDKRELAREKRSNVCRIQVEHTWEKRAKLVADVLLEYRGNH